MKDKILDMLTETEDYVSGEKISARLGISRNAVWKHINGLKKDGYEIASVTRRGYKLLSCPDTLTALRITNGLKTQFIGRRIICFDETDSTNTRAKNQNGEPDGSLFIAELQKAGKGRTGRSWSSPKGSGIWMSLLLKPELPPENVTQITLTAGLAVCRAIGKGALIKWPNDIVIGSKKVCGILTEMSAEIDRVNYIVCGIGINVNTPSFDEELEEKATSLLIETGEKHDRAALVRRVLEEFEPLYIEFLKNGIKNIIDSYGEMCVTLNREIRVVKKDGSFTAHAVGISPTGALIADKAGEITEISAGEVSVRGICGYI